MCLLPQQPLNSQRDAATLTEDSRGLRRALRLAKVKTLDPEEEEEEGERSSGVGRLGDWLGKPAEQASGSEEDFEEELELMEGRKQRHTGVEAKRSTKTAGRYPRSPIVYFSFFILLFCFSCCFFCDKVAGLVVCIYYFVLFPERRRRIQ